MCYKTYIKCYEYKLMRKNLNQINSYFVIIKLFCFELNKNIVNICVKCIKNLNKICVSN